MIFHYQDLENWAIALLEARGFSAERAQRIARVQTEVEAFGVTTHGLTVVAVYANLLKKGGDHLTGEVVDLRQVGGLTSFSGEKLLGIEAVLEALDILEKTAPTHGVAWAGIRRTGWSGTLGYHLGRLAHRGLLCMGWVQMAGQHTVVPHNGVEGVFATNPMALAIPRSGDAGPIIADFSTSAVSRGVANRWKGQGRKAPEPIFVTPEGELTDDPANLEDPDRMLPFGGVNWGYKGMALCLWAEALTAMAGGNPALPEKGGGQSIHILAVSAEALGFFGPGSEAIEEMIAWIESTKPMPGSSGPRMPGSRGWQALAQARQTGIPIDDEDKLNWFRDVSQDAGVEFPTPI